MSSGTVLDTNYRTLTGFLVASQGKHAHATGELTQLMNGIQTAVKAVSNAVRHAGSTDIFGVTGSSNIQGEEVKKLDVIANELFINMLKASYSTCLLVTEENSDPIVVEHDKQRTGKYIVCFDPLDGSSNIDCLGPIGSIFAVLRRPVENANKPVDVKLALQTGRHIVAAGYALYGSATMMVLSLGNGVHGFMLDPSIGEFILTRPQMNICPRGNIYSVNEGYASIWTESVKKYVKDKKFPENGSAYGARYIGSMVADVHRTLVYGGIFIYPHFTNRPGGKLRLLYECNPMAFIMEQAGGMAVDDKGVPILDRQPKNIHERCPIFLGSGEDVKDMVGYLQKYDK